MINAASLWEWQGKEKHFMSHIITFLPGWKIDNPVSHKYNNSFYILIKDFEAKYWAS